MTNHRPSPSDHQARPDTHRHHRRYGLALGVLVLGMLFWARILIIADIPKQAIADDPNAQNQPSVQPEQDSAPNTTKDQDDAQDSPDA